MINKLVATFAFGTVMAASGAQGADMPMTTDDYINNVVKECFNKDLSSDHDKWKTDSCIFTVANSNRDLAYKTIEGLRELGTEETLHTSDLIENFCSPEDLGLWLEAPTEINEDCVSMIGYAGQFSLVNEFQFNVMHLAPMAHTSFKTAEYNIQANFVKVYGHDRLDANLN